jgi:3-oxoacyl-[acyl-carrier-protein] synthase-1
MTHRAYFAGASVHCALGQDTIDTLAEGQAPAATDSTELDYSGTVEQVPYRLLPEVALERLENRLYEVLDPVVEQALARAELPAHHRRAMGLFVGTSSADVSISEARYRRHLAEHGDAIGLYGTHGIANVALHLRQRFALEGPDYSFNTACTSSANALMSAVRMVEQGRLGAALVVGTELFNGVTAAGFQSLGLLAPESMRPFDRDRRGFTLGEGCSALVLTRTPSSANAWHLRGSATLSDGYSMSTANPDGSSIASVIGKALARARLAPDAIQAIKVHGTATLQADEGEAAGTQEVFEALPPLCALKPHLGHTMGACGLNELLVFCRMVDRGLLPATPGLATPERADLGPSLTQAPTATPAGHFMLNYFGFGGNNTSLVVSNVE